MAVPLPPPTRRPRKKRSKRPRGFFAASDEKAEKEAFEAAKGLGTVEAFLTHYPNGFRADLARAYVKKLADQPQAAPSPPSPPTAASAGSTNNDFPAAAGSWEGVLRDGPGQQYRRIGSLAEGEPVTLMARTEVMDNGFPSFKITTKAGQTGYQWGGILCAIGTRGPTCSRHALPGRQARATRRKPPPTTRRRRK